MTDEKPSSGSGPPDEADQATARARATEVAPDTLRLLAEELSVDRREIETGRVRIVTVTREHEELVDVPLAREGVEVVRVPIDRVIDTMPSIRQDGETTVVPVVEEVVVVERRLMLKEELHIKRVRTTERHQERINLRRQEAIVTRMPAGTSDADKGSTSGQKK
jgi:uncharacterized protein (TIGR02271 family)